MLRHACKFILSVILISTFSACGLSEPATQDNVAETDSAFQTAVAATLTAEPTNTVQPTPTPLPVAEFSTNANCRSSPGAVFNQIVLLKPGDTAEILGKNLLNTLWYLLQLPDGRQCWVMAGALSIAGDASGVAAATSPVTPTPAAKVTVTEPTTITIWHMWGGDYLTAIREAFAAYKAKNPLVTIELVETRNLQPSLAASIPIKGGLISLPALMTRLVYLAYMGISIPWTAEPGTRLTLSRSQLRSRSHRRCDLAESGLGFARIPGRNCVDLQQGNCQRG